MASRAQPPPQRDSVDRTPEALRQLLGTIVVVDTDAAFIYLGKLHTADPEFLCLEMVDVHEMTKSGLSKERYIHEARSIGVRNNRKFTWVNMTRVLSISRLDDVLTF